MGLSSLRVQGIAFVLLLGLVALPASAQWMWRDKNGQLHASDLPPPQEVPEKDVVRRPSAQQRPRVEAPAPAEPAASASEPPLAAASAPGAAKPKVDPELEARRARAEKEQAAKRKQEEERIALAKAENCKRAQEHLRTLDSGMRIARVNAQGEREIVDDAARAEEARHARDVIATHCR